MRNTGYHLRRMGTFLGVAAGVLCMMAIAIFLETCDMVRDWFVGLEER